MLRNEFHKFFKTPGPVVLPVIHVQNTEQTNRNIRVAIEEGAQGVFLINHDFGVDKFLPIIKAARVGFPGLWLGVNFLAVSGKEAFPELARLQNEDCHVDAYWADDARIDESSDEQSEAGEIADVKKQCGWQGMYFGGTAFKQQREVNPADHESAAAKATGFMHAVTTSGVATGHAADANKISDFRRGCGERALALASGVTPSNVHKYTQDVDAFLVATGINKANDFYNIDAFKLRRLLQKCRLSAVEKSADLKSNDRHHRWYLSLMAPRSRGEKYAWVDPSSAYINARSFHAILDDLLEPFNHDEIDVVAGLDAAGFVLAAAMATRLGKGCLTIRKGGKIPVDFDVVPMNNYSGQTQEMELRKPAFAPQTRVLLVDQWVETGGTMNSGIQLVIRQKGIVAGVAAVCIEDNVATKTMREKYKVSSCVVQGTDFQDQCNRQTLESFSSFKSEMIFPDIIRSNKTQS